MKKNSIKLMPNCSELVMKLDIKDKRKILKELKGIGITEVGFVAEDYYGDWAKGDKSKERFLIDEDNPNLPDIEHGAYINLVKEDGSWAISGHQHCQHQIFPTLKKIQEHFGGEVYSTGGSTDDYDEWDGEPAKDYNGWVQVIRKEGEWTKRDEDILSKSKKKMKDFKKVAKLFNIKLSQKKKDILTQICVLEAL